MTPKQSHWTTIKRILCYLKLSINHGLFFSNQSPLNLYAYSDADWAGCPNYRPSPDGFCFFLGHHLISWSSHKQNIVARSSTEAKYCSLTHTTAELIWLQTLIRELGFQLHCPPILWCDNLGATYLTSNLVYHSRTKHLDIDFHFIRDRVAAQTLQVSFCNSTNQLANNVFTMPLVAHRFSSLRVSLNFRDTPMDSKGHINILSMKGNIEHISINQSQQDNSHITDNQLQQDNL